MNYITPITPTRVMMFRFLIIDKADVKAAVERIYRSPIASVHVKSDGFPTPRINVTYGNQIEVVFEVDTAKWSEEMNQRVLDSMIRIFERSDILALGTTNFYNA